MTQRINEQIGTVPAIEAELHLFKVGREMLRAESMPCSHDAALEQAESGFDGVGVNVSHDIHPATVLDGFVILVSGLLNRYRIRGSIVGHNHVHILADILADEFRQRSGLCIACMEESEIAVTFADSEDHFLVVHASDAALPFVHSADISCIQFHCAVEQGFISLRHSVPDAMAEVPRSFVAADSECALNLTGGHALLRFAEKKGCSKPRCKWQVRIIENCSSGDRELIVTVFAIKEMFFRFQFDYWAFAAQAARAFWEAQARQKFAALGIGREQGVYVH